MHVITFPKMSFIRVVLSVGWTPMAYHFAIFPGATTAAQLHAWLAGRDVYALAVPGAFYSHASHKFLAPDHVLADHADPLGPTTLTFALYF